MGKINSADYHILENGTINRINEDGSYTELGNVQGLGTKVEHEDRSGLIALLVIISVIVPIVAVLLINKYEDDITDLNELREKENELREKDAFISSLGNEIPFVISKVKFGTWKSGQTKYPEYLHSSSIYYLMPKICYYGLKNTKKKIEVRLYDTEGRLSRGTSSPQNCSYVENINIYSGYHELEISGWGNGKSTTYEVGVHRIEIWCEGKMLFKQSFKVY